MANSLARLMGALLAGAALVAAGSARAYTAAQTDYPNCLPNCVPHYFSHPNYANSPLRVADVEVVITDAQGSGATAEATVEVQTGAITAIAVTSGGANYTAPAITFTSPKEGRGSGAVATATVVDGAITGITVVDGGADYVTKGVRKFVDGLPGLTPAGANGLGQYIPLATPDTTTYPGSDYYEIALVQYREQMHSDLPPTLLRGYVQIETAANSGVSNHWRVANERFDGSQAPAPVFSKGAPVYAVDRPHYLGPAILAQKDRPVRIKFYNLLPTGEGGNLFVPVDVSVMGSGMNPDMGGLGEEMDPQNPVCGQNPGQPKPSYCYTENRATLHLHGGVNPWISDGSPHQWITPAGEITAYPQGVSVSPVPDMGDPNDPTDGTMTFYWTNQQSGRLMFYHDHAMGITRLNVYAGEAAAYVLQDPTEKKLVDDGILPGLADTIPLVIQDRTFVPHDWQLALSDETWDKSRWGGFGNLWMPHVYNPAQNPGDPSGVNAFGRWFYGPWFWPPVNILKYGPIDNPYHVPACDPDVNWCEPPVMPGTPFVSMGMEAFQDTPVVNGTAYPTVTVAPKAYRLRILNAANDRFFNLALYQADGSGTEVALNPDQLAAALTDTTVFPEVDETLSPKGPNWIQIGTEGGFLPTPIEIPAHVTNWVEDPTVFNAGNVKQLQTPGEGDGWGHSLLLGPAERADVVVDFSKFAGRTLILYNDTPAPIPAREPRYDYYTGSADLTSTGGVPTIPPGFGPNTRTIMQIKVVGTPAPAYDVQRLKDAFTHKADKSSVFEAGQPPIMVGQQFYNAAYGTTFSVNEGIVQIYDTGWWPFRNLNHDTLSMELQPKQIQDEMGEAFEHDYGRMSGNLGVETPNAQAGLQMMVLYGFNDPPTELVKMLPPGAHATAIAMADDGTQLWRITHNGVDTHPVHFHLFDVQLINRVGWDGIVRMPDANELGWKDTVRIAPLEDTVVALRPRLPTLPFDMPNSFRLLDPTLPEGAVLQTRAPLGGIGFGFDPNGNPVEVLNHPINFGMEYVWHCHILSHEEMDMMRPIVAAKTPNAPSSLRNTVSGGGNRLIWTDNSADETSFILERANDPGFLTGLTTVEVTNPTYTDPETTTEARFYRVTARNTVGDGWDYSQGGANFGVGFPTLTVDSPASPTLVVGTVPAAVPETPAGLSALVQAGPRVSLTWGDVANETGYAIERSVDGGATFTRIGVTAPDVATWLDAAVLVGTTYTYRVAAVNGKGTSAYSAPATATVPGLPAAPTGLSGTPGAQSATLNWSDNASDETGFVIQQATNLSFTTGLATYQAGENATAFTTPATLTAGQSYYFRVQAQNAAGYSNWSNIARVTPLSPPSPPVANADYFTMVAGSILNVAAPGVLANDSGGSGTLQAVAVGTPLPGLTLNADGSFTYDTRSDPRITTVSFQYKASDGAQQSAAGRVTIRVTANNAPVTVADNVSTAVNTPVTLRVLANDYDPDTDGDPSNTIDPSQVRVMGKTTATTSKGGTAQVDTVSGTIVFTPKANFVGTDTFNYSVKDTLGRQSREATVRVTVQ